MLQFAALNAEALNWKGSDINKSHHGRLQIESRWGTFSKGTPPLGSYSPEDTKLSYRENSPIYTISKKPKDDYFQLVNYAKKHPLKSIDKLPTFVKKKGWSAVPTEFQSSSPDTLKNISVEDMRKGNE